jgi:hypothetical protein
LGSWLVRLLWGHEYLYVFHPSNLINNNGFSGSTQAVSLGGARASPTHGISADWIISKHMAHQTHNAETDAPLMDFSIPVSNLLGTWVGYGR